MLGKLIKHEFRATGRIMLPLYLVLLASAVGANAATRGLLETDFWFFDLLGSLLVMFFFLAIFGVFIESFVLMVQRFYKNLLQDEGYVMLTLPVSVHQHIWSKLIVSAVWFVLTGAVVILASCVMAFDLHVIADIWRGFSTILEDLHKITAYYAINGAAFLTELGAICFLALAAMCVQFYAALAVGHSAANHKMAWSVAAFFAMLFMIQTLMGSAMITLDKLNLFAFLPSFHIGGMAAVHLGMLFLACIFLIYGAIFYWITVFFLKRRLNLE